MHVHVEKVGSFLLHVCGKCSLHDNTERHTLPSRHTTLYCEVKVFERP